MPLKIGFDAKRAFFNRTGLGNYSRTLIVNLSEYFPENEYFLFTPKIKDKSVFAVPSNAKIIQNKNKLLSPLWRSFFILKNEIFKNIDIFHGLSHELPFGNYPDNVKKVVTIHDLIFIRYPELYNTIDRKIYIKKAAYACKIADKIVAISEQTKRDIVNFFGIDSQKIEVIYQSCNPIFHIKKNTSEKEAILKKYGLPSKFILFVGTVEARKNAMLLVKAAEKLPSDIVFVIIGRHTLYADTLKNYIADKKLNNIIFVEKVKFADLPAIYQSAEIFVYPSFFEGFGIPIIESFASGTPVITSHGGVFPEVGGDAALYINPYDDLQLAENIFRILKNPSLKQKMITKGYLQLKKFNPEKITNDYINLYYDLIK